MATISEILESKGIQLSPGSYPSFPHQNVSVTTPDKEIDKLIKEREAWNNGFTIVNGKMRRVDRAAFAHNISRYAAEKDKSDPFIGRRTKNHLFCGTYTPQDINY
jgi:hypothetical protein